MNRFGLGVCELGRYYVDGREVIRLMVVDVVILKVFMFGFFKVGLVYSFLFGSRFRVFF